MQYHRYMIAAIVAMAHGGVIGKQNDLPWYLPADLRRFKELTTGHTVIMGRKTADSIVARLGHGLPNRKNIVITRDDSYQAPDFNAVSSLDEALAQTDDDSFIIGGQQIYTLALPRTDRLYITKVHADIDGDTFFPEYDRDEWKEVERESHQKDDKNQYDYTYVTLDRVK